MEEVSIVCESIARAPCPDANVTFTATIDDENHVGATGGCA